MVTDDWKGLFRLEEDLCRKLSDIDFFNASSKIAYVYNPIDYASQLHQDFISRFFAYPKKVLFVGMNPGPFGMAQTGVPFGDVVTVRDWLKIKGHVKVPTKVHPKRPILGLKCSRVEISGARFWGLFRKKLGLSPDQFFANCFVLNVCPLLFLDSNGKNVALADIASPIRHQIEFLCDSFLSEVVELLKPKIVVAIGNYSAKRIKEAIKGRLFKPGSDIKIPASSKTREYKDQPASFQGSISLHQADSQNLECSPVSETSSMEAGRRLPRSYHQHIIPRTCGPSTSKCIETTNDDKSNPRNNTTTLNPASREVEVDGARESPVGEGIADVRVCTLMHPSPANPASNRGWDEIALRQLQEFGVLDCLGLQK